MTIKVFSAAMLAPWILLAGAATAASPQAPTPERTASRCAGCHQGSMSLAGRDAAALAETIQSILSGARPHPPLELDDASEAAVRALAEQLANP